MSKLVNKSILEIVLIYSIVLLGALHNKYTILSFAPHEILVIILFLRIMTRSKNIIRFGNVDFSFFIFYLGVYVVPIFFNLNEYKVGVHRITENILIVKIWFIFKIFETYLLKKDGFKLEDKINLVIKSFLNAALISAILGLIFFFDFIDKSVLYKTKHLEELRLSTTVGGINTTGVFFALMLFTELFFSFLNYNRLRSSSIVRIFFFILNIVLSGSMTGLGIMIISVVYFYLQQFRFQRFIGAIITVLVVIIFSSQLQFFSRVSEVFTSRTNDIIIDNKYEDETFLPENFYGRYLEWVVLTKKILKEKPIMGYGFKAIEYDGARETNFRDVRIVIPESYYMNILIFGGLFGFICFVIHILINISVILNSYPKEHPFFKRYVLILVISYLFAQTTQTTLQYSSLSEFYGVLLAFLSILNLRSKTHAIKN